MRLKTRNKLMAGLGALAAAGLLAGCGGGVQPGDQSGSSSEGASSNGSELTAWAVTGGVHEQLWNASFDWWNEEHPDEPFSVEMFANDAFKEKIRTAVGAGNAPTLIWGWAGGTLKEYVDNDKVVDITEGTKDVLERVIPSVADVGRIDDKVYAIPNAQSQPVILYYNQDLFDQVGLSVPTTWDELMDSIPVFKDAGIAPLSVAGQSKWPYLMYIQYLSDRIGGPEAFNAVLDGEEDAWSNPAFAEALTKIQDLVREGAFIDGYGSIAADANADQALLYTGRAAMLLQGSWVYSSMKADAPEMIESGAIGGTTFPSVEGGLGDPLNIVGNPSNYWSVSSTATAEQQKIATEYLNDIVFDEQYTDFLLEGGGVPPVLGLEDKLAESDDADFLTLAYSMVRDAPHFQLSWDQALPSEQAQELLTNLEKVFMLQSTPEEFVDAMNATLK